MPPVRGAAVRCMNDGVARMEQVSYPPTREGRPMPPAVRRNLGVMVASCVPPPRMRVLRRGRGAALPVSQFCHDDIVMLW